MDFSGFLSDFSDASSNMPSFDQGGISSALGGSSASANSGINMSMPPLATPNAPPVQSAPLSSMLGGQNPGFLGAPQQSGVSLAQQQQSAPMLNNPNNTPPSLAMSQVGGMGGMGQQPGAIGPGMNIMGQQQSSQSGAENPNAASMAAMYPQAARAMPGPMGTALGNQLSPSGAAQGNGGAGMNPMGTPQSAIPGQQDQLGRLTDAIAHVESGGSKNPYALIGPQTRSGDRAYGKYQVMGNNVGTWTKSALGQAMTPQQFVQNPAAQDAVARHVLGSYAKQYGNVGDAASVWFSGRPMHNNNSRDLYGTSVPQYVNQVMKHYGS